MEAKTYNLAEFVRFALQKSNLNAPRLAKILGVHRSTINNWLNGKAEKVPGKLELAKDTLHGYGINIGKVTDTTIEVLPEVKFIQKEGREASEETARQLTKLLNFSGHPQEGYLATSRKECSCGLEEYIRSVELTVVHLVRENIALKMQLYGDNMKRG